MKVLVDTGVWSLAFRRRAKDLSTEQEVCKKELAELLHEGRAQILGAIRQELLCGFHEESQFQILRDHLRLFPDEVPYQDDYEEAARIHNRCRAAGVSGSPVDFLICAVALRRDWGILSLDLDFQHYSKVVPLNLYTPRVP